MKPYRETPAIFNWKTATLPELIALKQFLEGTEYSELRLLAIDRLINQIKYPKKDYSHN